MLHIMQPQCVMLASWQTEFVTDREKGPVHAENMPEPASKEELKKRAEELNN